MTGCSLTNLHFVLQEQTLKSNYYINNIFESEVKPLVSHRSTSEKLMKRKLFSFNRRMTFLQGEAPAHTAMASDMVPEELCGQGIKQCQCSYSDQYTMEPFSDNQ